MQTLLYLVRHGRTLLNQKKLFRGDEDPNLAPEGYKDANEVAFWLSNCDISFIVCSDKKRAATTADIISAQLQLNQNDSPDKFNLHPVYNELLRPWNIGDFGGLEKTPKRRLELQKYIDNPELTVPGGTSLSDFRERIRPLLREAVEASNQFGVPGLLVVHSSVIHEAGETFGGHHEAGHVKPGGVAAVFEKNGKLDIAPIFKPDKEAGSQNVLGTSFKRTGENS